MTERQRRRRRLAVGGLLYAVIAVLVVVGAPAAQAHAFLTGSNPADGAVLETAPTRLVLDFSESVVLPGTVVEVVNETGAVIPVGAPNLLPSSAGPTGEGSTGSSAGPFTPSGAPSDDTEKPFALSVSLPPLERGSYRVTWTTVSSDDLHRASGTVVFGIRTAVTAQGWVETAPSPPEALLRWLVLIGIAAGVGALVSRRILHRVAPAVAARSEGIAETATVWLGLTAATASLLLLLDQLAQSGWGVDGLLSSGYTARWGLREVGLLFVVGGARARLRASSRHEAPAAGSGKVVLSAHWVSLVGVLAAAGGTAMLGHSGSGVTGTPTRVLASTAHILASGCWMGTLGVILLVVIRGRPAVAELRQVLRLFGAVASIAVALMVGTGLYLASGVVGSVDALLVTDYGRVLCLKLVVVAGCGVVALITRHRLRASGRGGGVRLLAAEVVGGAVILGLTGLLTSGQPALQRQLMSDPTVPGSIATHQRVADLEESLTIRPNVPGQNVAIVQISNTRRPAPAQIGGVSMSVVGSSQETVTATPIGDGGWSLPLTLTESGPVTVRVNVTRQGLPSTTGDLAWTTAWPPNTPQPFVSRTPLRPLLVRAAVVAFVILGIGLVIALRNAASRQGGGRRGSRPEKEPVADREPVATSEGR